MKFFRNLFRTANASEEMQLSALITENASDMAAIANGDWGLIAPYGEHPAPDGSYVQKFDRDQAEKVVRTWNSITGMAARCFKNMVHGLGTKFTSPIWEGHPESNKKLWPKEKLLGEITDLRTGNNGLEGRVTWNAKGMADRMKGKLYPSALWWHWPPSGQPRTVYPELLESVGLWPTPNIPTVPAWTQNALADLADFASQSEAGSTPETTTQNTKMERNELIRLLGLPATATDEQINSALLGVANTANALTTANAAKADLEGQLATANTSLQTANAQIGTLTTERDELKTANSALTTANAQLVKGVLDIAEKRGAITAAERPGYETRLTTANTAGDALTELETRQKVNVTSVELNGNRVDITTANARSEVFSTAVQQRMKTDSCDYNTAFSRCMTDPALAALVAAMADPTRKDA